MDNKDLKRRIIEISYKHRLSHLGSCLTAVDIIYEIYQQKKPEERFVLSSGHAGLALYVVIEKMLGKNAEEIFEHHGVHPDKCDQCHLYCSTGSLGQGLPIAVGMALADRKKNVYCLISDGECAEGSIGEALRIRKQQNLNNCKVYLNWNGFGAYGSTDWITWKMIEDWETDGLEVFDTTRIMWSYPEWLQDQQAHYKVMGEEDYKQVMERLK